MATCQVCQQDSELKNGMCEACIEVKIKETWKKQMRVYMVSMVAGVLLIFYAYMQFSSHHFSLNDAPSTVLMALVLGGLGLMGGLFGFALAAFFNLWHAKKA